MTAEPAILFTAFEPSGDDHAAHVIAELKRRRPGLRIYAWGGAKMAVAGAEVIERTGEDAVMGMPGLAKIREHRRINERIAAWLDANDVVLHVPVDSPAANFPVCALAKARGISVVHLVAPQIWAWGRWRIRKLRKLTDKVLCLLPFEQPWFAERGVPAEFIGHPLFDKPVDTAALDAAVADWPTGDPKVVVLPGSRPAEIRRNLPLVVEVFRRVQREHPNAVGVVAGRKAEGEDEARALVKAELGSSAWPERLRYMGGSADAAIRWADVALVVSGTVTLQVARQQRPMVIVYKSDSRLVWSFASTFLVRTRMFSLPNLIAGREIVPELIPHFGGPEPVAERMIELLEDPSAAAAQKAALAEVAAAFNGREAASNAADAIETVLGELGHAGSAEQPAAVTG